MHILSTSDFGLASYALCQGIKLIRIDRTSSRATFILQGNFEEEKVKNEFWSNSKVGVSDFIGAQTQLKKRLYSDAF